jgi:hypothetical protein
MIRPFAGFALFLCLLAALPLGCGQTPQPQLPPATQNTTQNDDKLDADTAKILTKKPGMKGMAPPKPPGSQ